ncbi:NMT1/THI5 like protein [Aquimixticola soesokkakensis]|uniref:NMT1/THI5 like protein n=1 Tax=Aquimixticola soesokkakensis TaxID=1519096 RepID=A0A1Y5TK22_9RHOB|nr:ABC transporter substrate-binding protein [Aquimixticola soesokkakensis]SLN63787.1 NMT1/THI5 like protein [Aquimixticola soesokkakensis]
MSLNIQPFGARGRGLWRAVAALWIACLGLVGGAASAEPFRLIVTHLEPPLLPNSVMDLAQSLGYFEAEGVEVDLVRVQQTPSAIAALKAGEGEMANISLDALLQLHAMGDDSLRAVVSPNTSLPFLIAARAAVASPEALAGKTFGIGRVGSLDHALSMRVLAEAGVGAQAVSLVALGQPATRAQALAAQRIDATTMSVGVWSTMPDRDGLHVLVSPEAYFAAAPLVNKVNVVPRAVLETRPREVQAVIRALLRLSRDIAAEPDLWVRAMSPLRADVGPEALRELVAQFSGSWMVNGGMNAADLLRTRDWLIETGELSQAVVVAAAPDDLSAWVDFAPLDAALRDLGVAAGADPVAR